MKSDTESLIGRKFGKLLVISFSHYHSTRSTTVWDCLCDCGKHKKVARGELISKTAISCGCYRKDVPKEIKHGLINHPLYRVWADIKTRCYSKSAKSYVYYGGRGIKMCDEWKNDFKLFYDWSISNGWEKGLQIDRYPNNNGNYEPINCRYATRKDNIKNRRCSILIEINGILKSPTEWGMLYHINPTCIANRYRKGIIGEEAVYGKRKKYVV